MSNYRPIDSKREEFRKYLERCGVLDALTKVLTSLYEESDKTADALEYVCKNLTQNIPRESGSLNKEDSQISALKEENRKLRERLGQYEEVPPPVTPKSSPGPKSDENASQETSASKVGSHPSRSTHGSTQRSAAAVSGGSRTASQKVDE